MYKLFIKGKVLDKLVYFFENFLLALAIFIITALVERLITFVIRRFIKSRIKKVGSTPTNVMFFGYLLSGLIYTAGLIVIIYTIPPLKNIAFSLFAGAGILAAIIGFASQQAISNVISGIFIVVSKPFRVGDRVDIGTNYEGFIEDITLRHTVIRNFENRSIIIPNSIINSETIINHSISTDLINRHIEFNVALNTNLDKAMAIIKAEAEKHPLALDHKNLDNPNAPYEKVTVRVVLIGEYFVRLRAYVWGQDTASLFMVYCDLNKTIKERFEAEGIEIPVPYRKIVN